LLEHLDREIEAHVTSIHLGCDHVSTPHGQEVRTWVSKHPRAVFHLTPVHCSWMNHVEQWFSLLPRQWNQEAHPCNWSPPSVAKVMAEAPALAA
jgi:hypothetical protein